MQSPSKLSVVSLPRTPVFSGPQGWADLPDGLLHSIVARLGSFRDLLVFAAACPSWRAAFSSYPSKSMLRTKLPPLLIQPHVRAQGPVLPATTNGYHQLNTCVAIDPANPKTSLRCWIPVETTEKMIVIGSSYGNIIYFCHGKCHIVDVFTGVEVSTPRLPSSVGRETSDLIGTLTSPLETPNPHLFVIDDFSLFDLPIGSDSWSKVQLPGRVLINQIVEFNGKFIVSDGCERLYALQLAPQLGVQEIPTKFQDPSEYWLGKKMVVCGGMLLIFATLPFKKVYRLDMSTEPATWMAVEKLDNWVLFLGGEGKSTPLSCMSSELFGLGGNIVLYADPDSRRCRWTIRHLCGRLDTPPNVGGGPDRGQDMPPVEPDAGGAPVLPAWPLACTSREPREWASPLPCTSSEPWFAGLPSMNKRRGWTGPWGQRRSPLCVQRRPLALWLYPSMFYSGGQ